ncbi:MAG: DNA gyrase subunit A [Candidatus Bipolaricaulia bacterium]
MGRIETTYIEREMEESYINYAMSVIRGRAIPEVRDGLKPVQRRILYGMHQLGLPSNKPPKKAARIVGTVMGQYHPHGDQAVYDTLVNMAQDFSFRYPLIDGQGNFGSLDGDAAAAMRYTEARLSKISERFLDDLGEDTVDFVPNFDDSLEEPEVLPTKVPNLLLNGSWGISVGMTTRIPPHNLGELVDGLIYLIEDPDAGIDELMGFIPGPDFPTGGIILGWEGIRKAYHTSRGKIRIRSKAKIEENQIIITEIPYLVKKSTIVESIAKQVRSGGIGGISDLRDESDREGLRIVVEVKNSADPQVILNQLYRYTPLEWTFSVELLVIKDGDPRLLTLKEALESFLEHRRQVVARRTRYRLTKARERAHILEGLQVALEHSSEVIKLIRGAESSEAATKALVKRYEFSERQADAILRMRLRRLTTLEQQKIADEASSVAESIQEYETILESRDRVAQVIREELEDLKARYADARRTSISEEVEALDLEALIPRYNLVLNITNKGYVNAPRENVYKKQHRGGKGVIGIRIDADDRMKQVAFTNTHGTLLIFTDRANVYRLPTLRLPSLRRDTKGRNLRDFIELDEAEQVQAILSIDDFDFDRDRCCLMVTEGGIVNRNLLTSFQHANPYGIIAFNPEPDDRLAGVTISSGGGELVVGTANGKVIRFKEGRVRCTRRPSRGVFGIRLEKGDRAVDIVAMEGTDGPPPAEELLMVTENGYGKRIRLRTIPLQGRGGKGVLGIRVSRVTGRLIALEPINLDDEVLLATRGGQMIRILVKRINRFGRYARGVKLIGLDPGDRVASVAKIPKEEEEEQEDA